MSSKTESPMIKPELVYVCSDFVEAVEDQADEFLDSFPDETRWFVPVKQIRAFDEGAGGGHDDIDGDALEERWRAEPETVQSHVVRALAEYGAKDEALQDEIVENAEIRVVGYTASELYDVGMWDPENVVGRTIHIRGQVTKRSKRKLRDEVLAFNCIRCGSITRVPQKGEKMREPGECRSCQKQGPFNVKDGLSDMRDFQILRLQTLPEEADGTETEMIDVRVYDDLVGELTPGDRAIVTSRMQARREGDSRNRELYADGRDITKLTSDHTDVDVDPYRSEIEAIADGNHPEYDDPFAAVVDSVAPFHEGNDTIKEAIAYQLFGGIEKELPDGSWFRGNSHVLLMGDPGTGKSAVIRYVKDLVPRSEAATGKKSSSAGLTASAVKDDFADGGWTLQAGTLVRAHNGVAVIDELDKMDEDDREGMVEAMSEQQITVSMVVSGVLPASCSVLAAANPKYGSFDDNLDIGDQIDLDDVLLSRFDLKFMLMDEPDEEKDTAIAESMTESARAGQRIEAGEDPSNVASIDPPIPPEMFRAYIALARRQYPSFTDDAADRVTREYVELRQQNAGTDAPIPSTARQVEAIHRLSEASARIRLDSDILEDDVQRAIDILHASFESLGIDDGDGGYDVRQFEGGTSSASQDRRKSIQAIVEGLSDADDAAPHEEVKSEAKVVGIDEERFEREIEKLLQQGDLYEPETNKYRTA